MLYVFRKTRRIPDVSVEGSMTQGAKFDSQLTRRSSWSQQGRCKRSKRHLWAAALFVLGVSRAGFACATVTVDVIATDPPGANVLLPHNENFYVRLRYVTDMPISIWARPYYQGREVNAGSNPSRTYTGTGEALGWFFFMQPGDQVDEIRITAGDGSRDGTHLVATQRVHVVGGTQPIEARTEPAWVARLNREDKAAQQADYERRMNTPPSAGDVVLFNGLMLTVLALGVFAFGAPAWALWRWRGGWRIAAAIPAVMMAFVVVRIGFGVSRDPTSHNLWPFEFLQVGAVSVVIMAALLVARKFSSARH
jgi:hypothetical protein